MRLETREQKVEHPRQLVASEYLDSSGKIRLRSRVQYDENKFGFKTIAACILENSEGEQIDIFAEFPALKQVEFRKRSDQYDHNGGVILNESRRMDEFGDMVVLLHELGHVEQYAEDAKLKAYDEAAASFDQIITDGLTYTKEFRDLIAGAKRLLLHRYALDIAGTVESENSDILAVRSSIRDLLQYDSVLNEAREMGSEIDESREQQHLVLISTVAERIASLYASIEIADDAEVVAYSERDASRRALERLERMGLADVPFALSQAEREMYEKAHAKTKSPLIADMLSKNDLTARERLAAAFETYSC